MKKALAALFFLLFVGSAHAQFTIQNFSATGTIHMLVRITAVIDTRGNGQENLWASSAWEDPAGTPDPTGSIEEGSFDITGITGNAPVIRRVARWDNIGDDNRLILNMTGTDDLDALFDQTSDPYRLTMVVQSGDLYPMSTWTPPRTNGSNTFVDWREVNGHMTTQMWTFLDSIATNDTVIIAIHQGTASYTATSTKEYIGDVEIIKEYVGDVEITREYVGDVRVYE